MTATTRLSEIAASLQRGDALSGALEALEGWEARNIGAARMRAHVTDAAAQLAEVAQELQAVSDSLCPYCHSDNEAIRATYCDATCPGCIARHFDAPKPRRTWWQRLVGVRHE
jgi:hypothetical protein